MASHDGLFPSERPLDAPFGAHEYPPFLDIEDDGEVVIIVPPGPDAEAWTEADDPIPVPSPPVSA